MCVLALVWKNHPRWPLVLIGNRDELHARPAAPLDRWSDRPHIIAGRDLEAGGTWLGVSDQARLAVVTNVANPDGPVPGKVSRGGLITDLLEGSGRYAEPLASDLNDFNPFNAIAVRRDAAMLLTNRPAPLTRALAPGLYGLSNSHYSENWPKTDRIKAILEMWFEKDNDDVSALLDSLRADDSPQVEPRRAARSPIFICNPVYGTRCSTVVAINENGDGLIVERRYNADGSASGETRMDFHWAD